MSKQPEKVKIAQGEPPVEREVLADAIVKLSAAVQRLDRSSGLNRQAIVILLQAETKQPRAVIESVLDAAANLQRRYCK